MLDFVIQMALIGIITLSDPTPEMMIDSGHTYQIEATAYCNPNGNLTATGRPTTEGLTVATCKEWLGCTIYIWNEDMTEFYGIYEAMDTGGDIRIKEGKVIDIYFDSRETCLEFGRQNVTIQVVRGNG